METRKLTEARSIEEIEAEIAKLQQELEQAKAVATPTPPDVKEVTPTTKRPKSKTAAEAAPDASYYKKVFRYFMKECEYYYPIELKGFKRMDIKKYSETGFAIGTESTIDKENIYFSVTFDPKTTKWTIRNNAGLHPWTGRRIMMSGLDNIAETGKGLAKLFYSLRGYSYIPTRAVWNTEDKFKLDESLKRHDGTVLNEALSEVTAPRLWETLWD